MQKFRAAILAACCAGLAAQTPPPWQGVPAPFRDLPYPSLQAPATRAAWDEQRVGVRAGVLECLGEIPPRPDPPRARVLSKERRTGYTAERIDLEDGVNGTIPAWLVIPDGLHAPAPAVLVLHWFDGNKEGVLFAGEEQNVLEPMVRRGFVLMAIDGCFSGERLGRGPAGASETTSRAQAGDLYKLNLWLGRSLWGMMLRDQQMALDYLGGRPEVDPRRIGATGMSLGSLQAFWLAALDARVKAVVGVASFSRYADLVAARQLGVRNVAYFIPGLLKRFDTDAVFALVAPRALLALTADDDPASPVEGVRALESALAPIYALYDARDRFRSILYPRAGHHYLPEMKQEMVQWFERWLR